MVIGPARHSFQYQTGIRCPCGSPAVLRLSGTEGVARTRGFASLAFASFAFLRIYPAPLPTICKSVWATDRSYGRECRVAQFCGASGFEIWLACRRGAAYVNQSQEIACSARVRLGSLAAIPGRSNSGIRHGSVAGRKRTQAATRVPRHKAGAEIHIRYCFRLKRSVRSGQSSSGKATEVRNPQ